MSMWNNALFLILAAVTLGTPSQAEVHLGKNTLSVNVHETAIREVLDKLARQGDINVIALEKTQVGNVKISKRFWNLPLEEGLDRLLTGWNYGLKRDQSTGKIVTLYLVSQHPQPSQMAERLSTSSTQAQPQVVGEPNNQLTILRSTHNLVFPDYDDLDDEDDDEDTDGEYEEFGNDSELNRK